MNPHPFGKADVVYLPTDFWEDYQFAGRCFQVRDDQGHVLPSQRLYTLRGSMIACRIHMGPKERRPLRLVFSQDFPQKSAVTNRKIEHPELFENDVYRVEYGPQGITSIRCKESGEELLDQSAPALGAPVYQIFPGATGATRPALATVPGRSQPWRFTRPSFSALKLPIRGRC